VYKTLHAVKLVTSVNFVSERWHFFFSSLFIDTDLNRIFVPVH